MPEQGSSLFSMGTTNQHTTMSRFIAECSIHLSILNILSNLRDSEFAMSYVSNAGKLRQVDKVPRPIFIEREPVVAGARGME